MRSESEAETSRPRLSTMTEPLVAEVQTSQVLVVLCVISGEVAEMPSGRVDHDGVLVVRLFGSRTSTAWNHGSSSRLSETH